jgi:hypothetical protein
MRKGERGADKRASGVRDRGEGRADRLDPTPGAQLLTDGPGHRARRREAVSRDLGRAIKIGHGRSTPGGVNGCGRCRSLSRW